MLLLFDRIRKKEEEKISLLYCQLSLKDALALLLPQRFNKGPRLIRDGNRAERTPHSTGVMEIYELLISSSRQNDET